MLNEEQRKSVTLLATQKQRIHKRKQKIYLANLKCNQVEVCVCVHTHTCGVCVCAHTQSCVFVCVCACEHALNHVQIFCDPMDCSLPGFSIHGTFQARTLKRVTPSYSRGSSPPRVEPVSPALAGGLNLYHCTTWEAP